MITIVPQDPAIILLATSVKHTGVVEIRESNLFNSLLLLGLDSFSFCYIYNSNALQFCYKYNSSLMSGGMVWGFIVYYLPVLELNQWRAPRWEIRNRHKKEFSRWCFW